MGIAEIRIYLNKALKDFCRETEILSDVFTDISTVADQRYYELDPKVIKVTRVDYDDEEIPKLVGQPKTTDTD